MPQTPGGRRREDAGNPRIELYKDGRGKHRWRFWRSSDKVGQASQGYAERGDRDDNLCEVLGGQLRTGDLTGQLVLERHAITEHGMVFERIPVGTDDDA
jgi:hypothetical protein